MPPVPRNPMEEASKALFPKIPMKNSASTLNKMRRTATRDLKTGLGAVLQVPKIMAEQLGRTIASTFKSSLNPDVYHIDFIYGQLNNDLLGDDETPSKFDVRDIASILDYIRNPINVEIIRLIKQNIRTYYEDARNERNIGDIYESAIIHNIIDYLCSDDDIDFTNQNYSNDELTQYAMQMCGEEMENLRNVAFAEQRPHSMQMSREEFEASLHRGIIAPVNTGVGPYNEYDPVFGSRVAAAIPDARRELLSSDLRERSKIKERNLNEEYERLIELQKSYGLTIDQSRQLADIRNIVKTKRQDLTQMLEQQYKKPANPDYLQGGKKKTRKTKKQRKTNSKSKSKSKSKPNHKKSMKHKKSRK